MFPRGERLENCSISGPMMKTALPPLHEATYSVTFKSKVQPLFSRSGDREEFLAVCISISAVLLFLALANDRRRNVVSIFRALLVQQATMPATSIRDIYGGEPGCYMTRGSRSVISIHTRQKPRICMDCDDRTVPCLESA